MENKESRDRIVIETVAEIFKQKGALQAAMGKVAGFNMPTVIDKRINYLGMLIVRSIGTDTLKGLNQKWQRKFNNFASIEEGLAACYYHLINISLIEREVISQALDKAPEVRPEFYINGIEIPNTRRINFEYQALILSLRRTMDYLAVSVGAFFKCDSNSIRQLPKTIAHADPKEIRKRIVSKLEEKLKELPELVSPEGERSAMRDTIAHRFPEGAGTLNIFYTQGKVIVISFVGGGSKIFPWEPDRMKEIITGDEPQRIGVILLTPTLQALLLKVEELIFELYSEMGFKC